MTPTKLRKPPVVPVGSDPFTDRMLTVHSRWKYAQRRRFRKIWRRYEKRFATRVSEVGCGGGSGSSHSGAYGCAK